MGGELPAADGTATAANARRQKSRSIGRRPGSSNALLDGGQELLGNCLIGTWVAGPLAVVRRHSMRQGDLCAAGIAGRAKVILEYRHEARGLDAPAPAVKRANVGCDEDLPLALAREGSQTRSIRDSGLDMVLREHRDGVPRERDSGALNR